MPQEFTLSFWAQAEVLSTETYLINLFNRAHIKIVSSGVRFLFENGPSTYIEPTYTGSLNQITIGNWFYVSVSQREHKNAGLHQIEQRIVVANGRKVDAIEAGFKTDHSPTTYHKFSNSIFLGGLSFSSPNSFTGYLKEVKLFDRFHGSAQMINDRLRLHKLHSFDDPGLIAYWKLGENHTSTDEVQAIFDYSKHSSGEKLQVMFSPTTNSDYPGFVQSSTESLKLCYYHDVANCKALKGMPSIVSKTHRLVDIKSFDVQSSSHTIQVGEQILLKDGD